jgi:hypothetical protein
MSKRSKPLRYFFYHGNLHKKVHINRGADIITAFDYRQGKVCKHIYTDVRKNGEKAFSTVEVAKMIRRTRKTIEEAIMFGYIERPQITYGMDENRRDYAYYWSEKDIMDLHGYFITVHRGRPRKDGLVTPSNLPTASELRAMIRQGTVLYVKTDSGEFVPTWQADKF